MAIIFNPISSDTIELAGESFSYDINTLPGHKELHFLNLNINTISELAGITLYKYYSEKNLSYLLRDKRLCMDRVQSWEDCYENFFLKCNFTLEDYIIDTTNLIPGIFGQSWTTKMESDAMWRIYSQDKRGVRIKTNALKLFKSIYIDDECMANTWFGNIRYGKMKDFIQKVRGKIQNRCSHEVFRDILPETEFMKREEFQHEEEFRVVVMLDSNEANKQANYKRLGYKIDVSDFIEEFCLDPRLNPEQFEGLKTQLIRVGADPQKIVQSELYEFTPETFNLNC